MRLVFAALLALTGVARADRVASDPFQDLGSAAKCTDPASPLRAWCIAADFRKGVAAPLPKRNLIGISLNVPAGVDVTTALRGGVTLAALAITRDGKVAKLTLTDVAPKTDDEGTARDAALAMTTLLFNGEAKKTYLPAAVVKHLEALSGKYEAAKGATGWTWQGAAASELRKVGAYWVLVERAPKGMYATILTDQWTTAK
jgi:hypothetical protein